MFVQSTLIGTCAWCGQPFQFAKPYEAAKRRFCSRKCVDASRVRPVTERLWRHVQITDDCWLYMGDTNKTGYGVLRSGSKGTPKILAHRAAWAHATDQPAPDDLNVLHACDIRTCVRNDDEGTYEVDGRLLPRWGHLFLGTQQDNMLDRQRKGRTISGDQHASRRRPETIMRGSATPMAKLTEDDIRAIREILTRREASQSQVAARYGVHRGTITSIWLGKNWKHVT